jgi:hypothetical protein
MTEYAKYGNHCCLGEAVESGEDEDRETITSLKKLWKRTTLSFVDQTSLCYDVSVFFETIDHAVSVGGFVF